MFTEILKGFAIPLVVIGMTLAAFSVFLMFARNYRKCPPNKVLVVFGRKKGDKGYRLIIGGSAFVLPLLEQYKELDLETFPVSAEVTKTPNVDGVPVNVQAIANIKISSDPVKLAAAVERVLGKSPEHIRSMLKDTLDGLLRQIIGTLTVEEMVKDREKLNQGVLKNAMVEMNKLGFELDNFVINKLWDDVGYIDAMGAKRTADVKRDAAIAQAEATRESTVKSAEAKQLGETATLLAEELIAKSNRDLDIKKAGFLKETATAQAEASMAQALKTAEIQKELNQRVIAAQEAETKARITLAEQEAQRIEKELVYTVIRPAEAASKAATITADGNANAALKQAEATKSQAEAEKARLTLVGEGTAAAEAAGRRQLGLAEAEVTRAKGVAEGEAISAKLTAEALGLQKKNEALAQMSEGARFIILMEKLPEIIDELGDAGQKIVGAAFEQVGAGLSRIDSVHIVDMGNGSNGNGSGVAKFGMSVPEIVFGVITKAKALGLDVDAIMEKLGVPKGALTGLLGNMNIGSIAAGSGAESDKVKAITEA